MIDIFTSAHVFATALGPLTLVPTGHGAVCFKLDDRIIYVDPYSEAQDYTAYPKADLIVFSHDHYDHFDEKAFSKIRRRKTLFIGPSCVAEQFHLDATVNNGDSFIFHGIEIKAVPAYNILNKKPDGTVFHPKGYGNGYIFIFGDFSVYMSGDTELIPEMAGYSALTPGKRIDVAILAKNLPYTMSDEQFVSAVKLLKAPVVYPVHYFEIDRKAIEKAIAPAHLY